MKPGQIQPNEFELAILEDYARHEPAIRGQLSHLHVLSREYTGKGGYTNFNVMSLESDKGYFITNDLLINLPSVPGGMGALLNMKGKKIESLEVFTHANELWDGRFENFSISPST